MEIKVSSDSFVIDNSNRKFWMKDSQPWWTVMHSTLDEKFVDRVRNLNKVVTRVKTRTLESIGNRSLSVSSSRNRVVFVVRESNDTFWQQILGYDNVQTVVLPWVTSKGTTDGFPLWNSLNDTSNLLVQKYFDWTGDKAFCELIAPKSKEKNHSSNYVQSCTNVAKRILGFKSLDPLSMRWNAVSENQGIKSNRNILHKKRLYQLPPVSTLHLHVFVNVVITSVGDTVDLTGRFKFVQEGCRPNYANKITDRWLRQPVYKEVFVISQYWGYGYYHGMIEVLPRVAPFLDFLRTNRDIKVLVAETEPDSRLNQLLTMFGINFARLVSGDVRAQIAYVPPVTHCGTARVQQTQLLSSLYRQYIRQNFPAERQHRLILIRRSKQRRFLHQTDIEKVVKSAARDFGLTYTLFIDNPSPSINDTMRMFHSAVMIVAPHGAGEANVIFSPPGVYLIEGVCHPPYTNLCHRHTAYILGHHWHGIISRQGCTDVVDVTAAQIDEAVREHLHVWKQNF
jgi:capsular polysaccharide biosynthesis protein